MGRCSLAPAALALVAGAVGLPAASTGSRSSPPALAWATGSQWELFSYPQVCRQVGSDSMPIAWYDRNASTVYFLTSNHRHSNAGVGPSLDNLTKCNAGPVFRSPVYGPPCTKAACTPQSYANRQWLQSVRVFANGTAAALVHNEFHGADPDKHGAYCTRDHASDECQINSVGLAASVNGGKSFHLVAAPPHHAIAAPPHEYAIDQKSMGYNAISTMLRGADGAFYGSLNTVNCTGVNASDLSDVDCARGNCFFRATDLSDPVSFRLRDKEGGFTVRWTDPYGDPMLGTSGGGVCAAHPVDDALDEHVTFRKIVPALGPASPASKAAAAGARTAAPTFIALSDTVERHGSLSYMLSHEPDFGAAMRGYGSPNSSWTEPQTLDLDLPTGDPAAAGVAVDTAGGGAGCIGYLVSGAGSADANGCYAGNNSVFSKDTTHAIYAHKGRWHLGHQGVSVEYATIGKSSSPPDSSGGCGAVWKAVSGVAPCPSIKHVGLPPSPPPGPPPPPGGTTYYYPTLMDSAGDVVGLRQGARNLPCRSTTRSSEFWQYRPSFLILRPFFSDSTRVYTWVISSLLPYLCGSWPDVLKNHPRWCGSQTPNGETKRETRADQNMYYRPPRSRSTRWSVDSFWML